VRHWFDLIVISIFVLVQWRVTSAWIRRYPGRPARAAAIAGNTVLAVGYLFTFSEVLSRFHIPPRAGMLFGAATLSYLLLAVAVLAIQSVFSALARRYPAAMNPGRRRVLRVAMAAPVAALGYGSFIERHNFRVREIDLPLVGLPPGLEGLRLLQLSEIQLSAFLSEAELASVIDASNELRPHIALITGDLISSRGDPLDACLRQIARLKADAGIAGCLGNHERYADAEDYTAAAGSRLGVRFLRGQAEQHRFGGSVLNIAGVDYQRSSERATYLHDAESLLAPDACNVMLSHNPDVFPAAVQRGYNLLLAGHTHGGQVSFEILDRHINAARFFTPYVYGLYRSGTAAGYVTRGIGTVGIPARIGAPPEIALLRLRSVKG
jgi:uncharacterized protein